MIQSLHLAMPKRNDLRDYGLLIVGAIIQAAAMVPVLHPRLDRVRRHQRSGADHQSPDRLSDRRHGHDYERAGLPPGLALPGRGGVFFVRTVFTVVLYSLALDLSQHLVTDGPTRDPMLNALYGGVIGGVGMGITFPGPGHQRRHGHHRARHGAAARASPLAQSYLFADALVIVLGGSVFGWERALYAILALYIAGVAAEVVTEGANVVRTAIIVSDHSREVADAILREMERGVTGLHGEGMYTAHGPHRAVRRGQPERGAAAQVHHPRDRPARVRRDRPGERSAGRGVPPAEGLSAPDASKERSLTTMDETPVAPAFLFEILPFFAEPHRLLHRHSAPCGPPRASRAGRRRGAIGRRGPGGPAGSVLRAG